jgi:hypothetical protein
MENGGPAHEDDFAIKNATNIISKAEKAPSYSSLHALSDDAEHCTCSCRNRQEKGTAMAVSNIVIGNPLSNIIHSKSF